MALHWRWRNDPTASTLESVTGHASCRDVFRLTRRHYRWDRDWAAPGGCLLRPLQPSVVSDRLRLRATANGRPTQLVLIGDSRARIIYSRIIERLGLQVGQRRSDEPLLGAPAASNLTGAPARCLEAFNMLLGTGPGAPLTPHRSCSLRSGDESLQMHFWYRPYLMRSFDATAASLAAHCDSQPVTCPALVVFNTGAWYARRFSLTLGASAPVFPHPRSECGRFSLTLGASAPVFAHPRSECAGFPSPSERVRRFSLTLGASAPVFPHPRSECAGFPSPSERVRRFSLTLGASAPLFPHPRSECAGFPSPSERVRRFSLTLGASAPLFPHPRSECAAFPSPSERVRRSPSERVRRFSLTLGASAPLFPHPRSECAGFRSPSERVRPTGRSVFGGTWLAGSIRCVGWPPPLTSSGSWRTPHSSARWRAGGRGW